MYTITWHLRMSIDKELLFYIITLFLTEHLSNALDNTVLWFWYPKPSEYIITSIFFFYFESQLCTTYALLFNMISYNLRKFRCFEFPLTFIPSIIRARVVRFWIIDCKIVYFKYKKMYKFPNHNMICCKCTIEP